MSLIVIGLGASCYDVGPRQCEVESHAKSKFKRHLICRRRAGCLEQCWGFVANLLKSLLDTLRQQVTVSAASEPAFDKLKEQCSSGHDGRSLETCIPLLGRRMTGLLVTLPAGRDLEVFICENCEQLDQNGKLREIGIPCLIWEWCTEQAYRQALKQLMGQAQAQNDDRLLQNPYMQMEAMMNIAVLDIGSLG